MLVILILLAFPQLAFRAVYEDLERGLAESLSILLAVIIVSIASSVIKYLM